MLIDSSIMSVMDISRFVNESNTFREYKDFRIETDSYVLMTKQMFDRLIEIADKHEECIYPTKRYKKNMEGILSKCLKMQTNC